ncbi:MAG TPA: hypothetical protein VMB34_29775 [Acetobacteraceae bacterium]|nr:hypothetical protein [Acetobacteraceae bacterium]
MTQDIRRFAPYADAIALRRRILEHINTLQNSRNLSLLASLAFMRTEAAFNAFLDAPSYSHLANLAVIEADMWRIPAALSRLSPTSEPSAVPDTPGRGLPAATTPPSILPSVPRTPGQGRRPLDPYAGWWSNLPRV